jgi:nifR3 family TIM-barrel protein
MRWESSLYNRGRMPMTPKPIALGELRLHTPLLLAPLAGYTDLPFRLIARSFGGVGLACTDLLCPQGILRQNHGTRVLMATCPEDSPLAYQLFGGDVEAMCEGARWCADHGARIIDINMGCPVDKVTRLQGGSAMLCDVPRTVALAAKMVAAVPHVSVTAKLRLGWDDEHIVAPQLASELEQVGIRLITIHGRTRQMGFSGEVRLQGIAEVVAAVRNIPVIGNGDIRSPEDAARMLQQTGCHGVMIGRAALGAPWIFRDVWSLLTRGEVSPPPTRAEKLAVIRRHFDLLQEQRGERAAVMEFRHRISWYAKHLGPCRPLRQAMVRIQSRSDFENALMAFELQPAK